MVENNNHINFLTWSFRILMRHLHLSSILRGSYLVAISLRFQCGNSSQVLECCCSFLVLFYISKWFGNIPFLLLFRGVLSSFTKGRALLSSDFSHPCCGSGRGRSEASIVFIDRFLLDWKCVLRMEESQSTFSKMWLPDSTHQPGNYTLATQASQEPNSGEFQRLWRFYLPLKTFC